MNEPRIGEAWAIMSVLAAAWIATEARASGRVKWVLLWALTLASVLFSAWAAWEFDESALANTGHPDLGPRIICIFLGVYWMSQFIERRAPA